MLPVSSSKAAHDMQLQNARRPSVAPSCQSRLSVAPAAPDSTEVAVKHSLTNRLLSALKSRINDSEEFAEKKIPLFLKFFIIAAPTLVALVLLSVYVFVSGLMAVMASGKTDLSASVSHCLMSVMTELQSERSMTVGLVESDGRVFSNRFAEQTLLTDKTISNCMPFLLELEQNDKYENAVESIKCGFNELDKEREYNHANQKELGIYGVQKHYNKLVDSCSELQADLARDTGKETGILPQSISLMRHRTDLMTLQQTYAMRRGEVLSVLLQGSWTFNSTDNFSPDLYSKYLSVGEWIQTEAYILQRYQNIHSTESWKKMQDTVLSLRAELTPYESNITQTPFTNFTHLDADAYFTKSTRVIEAIQILEDDLFLQLMDANQSYYRTNLTEMLIGLLLIVLFVIPITIVVIYVCRVTYRPIIRQKKDLRTASEIAHAITELDFESEPVKILRSKPLEECEELEAALRQVTENFLEYLPYIPRHMLVKDEKSPEADNETVSVQSGGKSTKSSRSSRTHETGNSSKNSSSKARRFARASKKNATLMVIDITDFSRIAAERSFEGLGVAYADFLSAISEIVYNTNGVVHSFSSGIFMCSWNAASTVFEAEKKAAGVALELINSSFSNPRLSFRMKIGIASGEVSIGELGNQEMRAFQIIGPPMTRALALSKLCHQYQCSIAVDQPTFKVVSFDNDLKQLDHVNFPNASVGEGIYQLIRRKQIRSDEWLYETEQAEKLNTFAEFHASWKEALGGNYKKAREHLIKFKEDLESKSNNQGLALVVSTDYLEDIISRGEATPGFRYKCHLSNWKAVNNIGA